MSNKYYKKGFTLIELLVVVSIVGLLSSVVLSSLRTARMKARDTKRIAQINSLNTALQLSYDDNNGVYLECDAPSNTGGCDLLNFFGPGTMADSSLDGNFMTLLQPKYMSSSPIDPVNSLSQGYFYVFSSGTFQGNNWDYIIAAHIENPNDPALSGGLFYGDPVYGSWYAKGAKVGN